MDYVAEAIRAHRLNQRKTMTPQETVNELQKEMREEVLNLRGDQMSSFFTADGDMIYYFTHEDLVELANSIAALAARSMIGKVNNKIADYHSPDYGYNERIEEEQDLADLIEKL